MSGEMVEAGHLGGYVAGGDPATYYPELWTWLVQGYGVQSVLDVGCGDGVAVRYFSDVLGIEAHGVDGVPQKDARISRHDYATEGTFFGGARNGGYADLVWSCEFVEHVEEQFVPNFLDSFRIAPLVLMTHAEPGQGGYHHVNCQMPSYWIGAMAAIGFKLDGELTDHTRQLAAWNENPWNHYRRSGLAFRRTS